MQSADKSLEFNRSTCSSLQCLLVPNGESARPESRSDRSEHRWADLLSCALGAVRADADGSVLLPKSGSRSKEEARRVPDDL